jgi:hypothetical protein
VLSRICSIDDALKEAEHNVRSAARNVAAVLAMGRNLSLMGLCSKHQTPVSDGRGLCF